MHGNKAGRIRRKLNAALWVTGTLLMLASNATAQTADQKDRFFENKVRPLLSSRCWSCHSDQAKGGLRLDSRTRALAGGGSGLVIVPGKPSESLLIKAIRHQAGPDLEMPPNGALEEEQIRILERWVAEGAVWPESEEAFFHNRVFPVLARSCLSCHSADEPENDLRVDSREALLRGGKTGPSIVPGKPDASLLIQAVRWTHAEFEMPLEKKLPKDEISLLEEWVARGAPWPKKKPEIVATDRRTREQLLREIWSMQPLASTANMNGGPSMVALRERIRRPMDRFVLGVLEALNLTPAAESNRTTWLRRASYALLGHPPSPDQMLAFKKDPDSNAKAMAHALEDLLSQPDYASHWTRLWLRDSQLGGRSSEALKAYEQWVKDQFGNDRSFSSFAVEHLHAAPATALATTDRDPHTGVVDRMGRTFLGMRLDCARCHDHPTDPITLADYNRLAGSFATVANRSTDVTEGGWALMNAFAGQPVSTTEALDGRKIFERALGTTAAPRMARVIVNRVVKHHLGQPLVDSENDFGRNAVRPTNPALLEYLAAGFVSSGWSLKWLHRELLLSAAFSFQAQHAGPNDVRDADNVFFWRWTPRVLRSDALFDSWAFLAGTAAPSQDRTALLAELLALDTGTVAFQGAVAQNAWVKARAAEIWAASAPIKRSAGKDSPLVLQIEAMYERVLGRAPDAEERRIATSFVGKNGKRGKELTLALMTCNEFTVLM
ncbi:MAG: DUF1549 domain-containing protein [Deltaproteobacteria bacterium]|nr:DUF1549 domain-containing protein [Deltaproteobacteria bacterium]